MSRGAPSSSFLRRGQLGPRQFVKNVMNFSLSLVAGYPTGYPTAAPAYNPNMYPTSSPGYAPGKTTLCMETLQGLQEDLVYKPQYLLCPS